MPKLLPQRKLMNDALFLEALQKSKGDPIEATRLTSKVGSRGGNPEKVVAVRASQKMKNLNASLLEALLAEGVTPATVAQKIKEMLDSNHLRSVDRAIEHALKIGVGGGYQPEKHLNVETSISEILDAIEQRNKQSN